MNVAIITARGGSKRIPKKNIKKFCGKPIIAYSIEAAIKSGLFGEVMVSTDSEEIANVAKSYGASVPFFRSKATSDDFASTADVLKEVLEEYQKRKEQFEWIFCLYPTAPFITSSILREAMDTLLKSSADSLMTVARFGCPPQRALRIEKGKLKYIYPEYERARSQDLETEYHDCGQFYICKAENIQIYGSLLTSNTIPFIIEEQNVQDIDNISDWYIAELKYIYQRYKERFEQNIVDELLKVIGGGVFRKVIRFPIFYLNIRYFRNNISISLGR